MILDRFASSFLRLGQFVSSAVVMGLMAYFLHRGGSPHSREIYTIVIAALSMILALIWLLPKLSHMMHYPADLLMALAWFAAFAILVNWINKVNCGNIFHWGGITNGGYCGQWKAAEAFSFISALFWLASALLGATVHHKKAREDPAGRRSEV